MSNGTNNITIPFIQNQQAYKISASTFPILYNTTYYLTVVDQEGRSVSATTTTPSSAIPSYEVNQTATADASNENVYQVTCKIDDLWSEQNYYRINTGQLYYSSTTNSTFLYMHNTARFVSDNNANGNELITTLQIYENPTPLDSGDYRARRVFLTKGNKDYYNFNQSVITANISGNNPFAEPTIIYTNIEGGFGCFGSYITTFKDIAY
jgi:Domain of unknown function (DUF4249)